jgi:acetate kinase
MNILVLNCGSSSLKFQLLTTDLTLIQTDADICSVKGVIERIGSQALVSISVLGKKTTKNALPLRDHISALNYVIQHLLKGDLNLQGFSSIADIHAIGHRVVHGGENFQKSALINSHVLQGIEDCIELAPLHNPANLKGIKAAREMFGEGIPQVAVFDTAFHSSMPELSYLYAIPYSLYRRHKIRRYGFHGTSHRYVAYRYRKLLQIEKSQVNIITLHLGNGCSACLIHNGVSVDTSMGFTPSEGLVMGSRGGDLDSSILQYVCHKEGITLDEADIILNKQSGLLGVSGLTNDMRELLEEEAEHQDRRATLAIEMFCKRVRKYIGAYFAEGTGVEAIVFTGGIGENSSAIRARICKGLSVFGIEIDESKNAQLVASEGFVENKNSKIKIAVIPTNEELLIARDTCRCVMGLPSP